MSHTKIGMYSLLNYTYWQWFCNSNANRAIASGFEDMHSIIQAGAFQVCFIHEHESVTRQQATISICNTSRNKGPDYQHCFSGIFWILEFDIRLERTVW